MNSITELWVQTCRHELLDRSLIWDQRHLLHTLRESGHFYNEHRPHRALRAAAPLHPLPDPGHSRAWLSEDGTGPAAPSTNTSMPPDQQG